MNWLAKQQREASRARIAKVLRGKILSSKEIVAATGMAKALVNRVLADMRTLTPPLVVIAGEYESQPRRFTPLYALAEEAPAEPVLRLMSSDERARLDRRSREVESPEIGEPRRRRISANEVKVHPVFDPFTSWIPRRDMREAA